MKTFAPIYCKRHRRKKFVDAEWAKTCTWLCPQCYNSLTEKQRDKYKPGYIKKAELVAQASHPTKTAQPSPSAKNGRKKAHEVNPAAPIGSIFKNSSLVVLLPRYRIRCQKCESLKPCHKSWFDQSKVLCPECYGGMSEEEIALFHNSHSPLKEEAENPLQIDSITQELISQEESKKSTQSNVHSIMKPLDESGIESVLIHQRYSDSFIRSASIPQLLKGVRKGYISKVRMNIEMKRRQQKEYFSDLPAIHLARL